jgi:hypothetical protein
LFSHLDCIDEPGTLITKRVNFVIGHPCHLVILLTLHAPLVDSMQIERRKPVKEAAEPQQTNANRKPYGVMGSIRGGIKL